MIVCELLKANLYEFHKFNREAGGEVYFTMPRLQVVYDKFSCQRLKPLLYNISLSSANTPSISVSAVHYYSVFGGTSISTWPWAYSL